MVKKTQRSEQLTNFLNFIKEAESEYIYFSGLLENENKITQDLLHKLELDTTTAKERNKIATLLANNRKDRRYYKNQVEQLQPIIDIINNQSCKPFLKQLNEALGKVRKAEEYHKNRKYFPRILRESGK